MWEMSELDSLFGLRCIPEPHLKEGKVLLYHPGVKIFDVLEEMMNLQSRLAEANSVINFYADDTNLGVHARGHIVEYEWFDPINEKHYWTEECAGKRAREYQKKWRKE